MALENYGHTIDDDIVQKSFYVIESFGDFPNIIGEYAIGGGVAAQLHLKENTDNYRKFIRRTGDVDIFATEKLTKNKFHTLVGEIEPPRPYKIESEISRTCYGIIVKSGPPSLETFSIHFPRYTAGRFDEVKEKEQKNISSSTEVKTDGAKVRVENADVIIREKMERSKKASESEKTVEQWISKMERIINEDPAIGKHLLDEARYGIGMSIEDVGFYSQRTRKLLGELKVKKDAYDIACLRSFVRK